MAVWVKEYAVEVKVEMVWVDKVFTENLVLSTVQCFVVRIVSSSSIKGGSINRLYSGPVLSGFLKNHPLRVDPKIEAVA